MRDAEKRLLAFRPIVSAVAFLYVMRVIAKIRQNIRTSEHSPTD
jgi:hypothetical protein